MCGSNFCVGVHLDLPVAFGNRKCLRCSAGIIKTSKARYCPACVGIQAREALEARIARKRIESGWKRKTRKVFERECPVCVSKFQTNRFNQKTCSQECGAKFAAKGKKLVREALMCSYCGGFFIPKEHQHRKFKRTGVFYCDHQCASDAKSVLYKGNGKFFVKLRENARNKSEKTKELKEAKELEQKRLQKGWKCCLICGKAHNNIGRWCSEKCMVRSCYVTKAGVVKCEFCGVEKHFDKHATKKFCSSRCSRKAANQRRDFWVRSNGPCDYIPLKKLVAKFGGKCNSCGVQVTRYNGSWRSTDASIDHVVPLSRGGAHNWGNVQLLCHLCNSIKSDSLLPA